MSFLIFLALSLPIILIFLTQKHKSKTKKLNPPPGPKGLPIIGNLHQIDNSNIHIQLWELAKKFGPVMSLRLGYRKLLVISDVETVKLVLKEQDLSFCSRPPFTSQRKISYNGLDVIFSPYDAYWRDMRKITTVHLFSYNRAQSYRPIRESEVSRMVKKISDLSNSNKVVHVSEIVMSLLSSITCRIGFGKRDDEVGSDMSGYIRLLNDAQVLFMSLFVGDYFPGFGFLDKLTGLSGALDKTFRGFEAFYDQLIKEHLDENRVKPDQEDILDVLLAMRKDPSSKVEFTFDHIKAVLMNVFLAGTDTSSGTIIWVMTYLMRHPKEMKKVQAEVRNMFPNKKGIVDEDDIQKLPYLKAVIKEVMRLQPVSPLLVPREVREDCKLQGYDIEAKTIVYVNVYASGRDPKAYENPDEFRPERFVGSDIDMKGSHYELLPFGAGRRVCPGYHMGIATVELACANLLYKFDWEMPNGIPGEQLDMVTLPGITMHRKNPLCLMASIYN